MKRENRDYIYDILHECEYLIKKSKNMDYTNFLKNEDLKKAFVRSLQIIGEAAKNIQLNIRKQYPDIPWREIIGMRNKITHEYFGVDDSFVWKTIEKDIPQLKSQIERLLNDISNHK